MLGGVGGGGSSAHVGGGLRSEVLEFTEIQRTHTHTCTRNIGVVGVYEWGRGAALSECSWEIFSFGRCYTAPPAIFGVRHNPPTPAAVGGAVVSGGGGGEGGWREISNQYARLHNVHFYPITIY